MRTAQIVTGAIAFLALPAALAQNLTQTRTGYNSVNVYAQQRIDLVSTATPTVTAFEASAGFEAVIKLPEATAGRWSAPARWTDYRREGANTAITGMVGIHTHVLPNGYVFSWEGHNLDTKAAGNASCTSHAYAWNPNPGARLGSAVYPNIYADYDNFNVNIFCGGHTLLADGRLLVAGGHYSAGDVDRSFNRIPPPGHYDTNAGLSQPIEAYRVSTPSDPEYVPPTSSFTPFNPNVNSYIGTRDLNIFNYRVGVPPPANNTGWQTSFFGVLPAMKYRRWYPTATTLADGRVLVVAGQRFGGPLGITPATTVQAEIPELYTPNASYSQTWTELTNASRRLPLYPWMFLAPDGQVFNAGPNPDAKFLNPTAGTWGAATYNTQLGLTREYGSAVMYAPGKILILGGLTPNGITNTAERIDLNAPASATFQPAAPMVFPRTHVNATILPDGSVLATGGSKLKSSEDYAAVFHAELWRPSGKLNPGGT